ncbi:MAG: NRDE family protein [Deltaproteobacteria bacterium]|nr:NRDE family protein [Deltaproteobacteria bacterium]
MCVAFLSYRQIPAIPLVLALNRDEYYKRPTEPAHFWTEAPHVLAGRDLREGGTWLGVNKSGNISLITSYRDVKRFNDGLPSRGGLVRDFVLQNPEAQEYLKTLQRHGSHYNGFNLVFGSLAKGLHYYSNVSGESSTLKPGSYTLSNHFLNTAWPKTIRGKAAFDALLSECSGNVPVTDLFKLMRNDEQAGDKDLPETGVGIELERILSAIFIRSAAHGYGTRSTTIVYCTAGGRLFFTERTYLPDNTCSVLEYSFDVGVSE